MIPGTAQDDDVVFARRAFEHVRDVVRHSFDVHDPRPSITASDPAVNGVGLCHAKSHLLVALLRSRNIPADLCYQRIGTPKAGHSEGFSWLRSCRAASVLVEVIVRGRRSNRPRAFDAGQRCERRES